MPAFIDGFEIDVNVTESHTSALQVTDFEVEEGANITDHARKMSRTVILNSVVSDTPIGAIASRRSADGLPSEDALAKLEQLQEDREPITIETDLRIYDNMILESLTIPRDKDNGNALRFSATFKEIRLVTNRRTTIRVSTPIAQRKQLRGTKPSHAFQRISDELSKFESDALGVERPPPPPEASIRKFFKDNFPS